MHYAWKKSCCGPVGRRLECGSLRFALPWSLTSSTPTSPLGPAHPAGTNYARPFPREEKGSLCGTLANKAEEAGYTIEPETVTYAHLVGNVPGYILAYHGNRHPTDPAMDNEVISVTKRKGGERSCSQRLAWHLPGYPTPQGLSLQAIRLGLSDPPQKEGAHLHMQAILRLLLQG